MLRALSIARLPIQRYAAPGRAGALLEHGLSSADNRVCRRTTPRRHHPNSVKHVFGTALPCVVVIGGQIPLGIQEER